jgi:Tfp pilus assembly protein PilO
VSASAWIVAQPIRTRRMIALLAVPTFILMLGLLIVSPILQLYRGHEEWLVASEKSVARDRGLRSAESTLRQQLADIDHSPLLTRLYPATPTGTLATALQADVGGLLARAGLTAQSISPLPSATDNAIERAGVRVALNATIDQLSHFLKLLESHPRLIRVDELVITAPQSQLPDHNPTLTVTLVMLGFRTSASH